MPDILRDSPPHPTATLVLAHGAGAPMDNGWMNDFTALLVERGIGVARFEFGYMAGRREGVRRPPPRAETLMGEYRDAVAEVSGGPLFIGGKSMGGRVASLIADELLDAGAIRGVVCLGYPFHPPQKPQQLRTAHLLELRTPTLICQGTRDEFGTAEEVPGYGLSSAIEVHWLGDGDHSFRPRKAISGRTHAQNLSAAGDAVAAFVARMRGFDTRLRRYSTD